MESKFKCGDRVRIVKNNWIWCNKKEYHIYCGKNKPKNLVSETEDVYFIDIHPETIGEEGIIDSVMISQDKSKYSISGTTVHAWFHDDNLIKIHADEKSLLIAVHRMNW